MKSIVLITGLSGAGKASILRVLEDLGFEAVDNLPVALLQGLILHGDRPVAIGLDVRTRGFNAPDLVAAVDRLRTDPHLNVTLVFACADTAVLLRRFTETRRRHPLAPNGRVVDGITSESRQTLALREAADLVIDTTELSLPGLRRMVEEQFALRAGAERDTSLTVALISFAFPAGLPREADMIFDARFLHNPHYDPILRNKTGFDPEIAAYIASDPDYAQFFGNIYGMLQLVLPRFVQEGKKYASVAVGCTGGRHRSVHIVERLAPLLRDAGQAFARHRWSVTVLHRELNDGKECRPAGSPLTPAGSGKG